MAALVTTAAAAIAAICAESSATHTPHTNSLDMLPPGLEHLYFQGRAKLLICND